MLRSRTHKLCIHCTTLHICLHGALLFEILLSGNWEILNLPGQQGWQICAAAIKQHMAGECTLRHVLWITASKNILVYHFLLPKIERCDNSTFIHYSTHIIILEQQCHVLTLSAATAHVHRLLNINT